MLLEAAEPLSTALRCHIHALHGHGRRDHHVHHALPEQVQLAAPVQQVIHGWC